MAEQNRKRIGVYDLVKGFAMLCIVAGHLSDGVICRFVFTFHVPVFLLIGGILFHSYWKDRLSERIMVLLKPYVFTVAAIIFLDVIKQYILGIASGTALGFKEILTIITRWLLAGLYGSGSRGDFFSLKMPVIGAIWFLLAYVWILLFMELGLHATKKLERDKKTTVIGAAVVSLFVFGWWSAKYFWLPFSIQAACVSLPFFAAGHAVKRRLLGLIQNIKITIIAVVIWAEMERRVFGPYLAQSEGKALRQGWFFFPLGKRWKTTGI